MSIEVTCDDCGRDFRVNEANAGKKVRCKCGASVRVPNDNDDFEDDDDRPARRASSGGRKKGKSKSGGQGAMVGILVGGGFGLVALLAIGIMMFRPGNNLPAPPQIPNTVVVPTIPTPTIPTPPQTAHTPGTTPTKPSTPTTPTTPANPNPIPVKPNPVVQPVVETPMQPLERKSQIGHDGADAIIAIAPGNKFVSIDRTIYDMASGDQAWEPPAAFGGADKDALLAVSPDGNALAEGDDNAKSLIVYFKEEVEGEKKVELPVVKGANKISFLRFADDKHLVAGFTAGFNTRVAVFSIDKPKKAAKDFQTDSFSQKSGAISSDGKFLAVASMQSLKVYDLNKGVSVATMAAPANGPGAFMGCSGVAFSPENDELAAVLGTGIVFWSNKGKVLEEYPGVVASDPFAKSNGLSYLPDKSGVFVSGQDLFMRASKMVVWHLNAPHFYHHPSAVFDADHILVSGGAHKSGQIATIKIPRDELAKAEKAIADKVDAILSPGSSISLEYDVGEPRFSNRQEVTNQIHAAFSNRIMQCGIMIAENQPIMMKVVYTEVAGDTTEYSEGRGFGPPIPRFGPRSPFDKPGQKVVETKHTFRAALVRKDDPRVWWSANIVQDAPQSLKGDVTDANVRNGSFENVKGRIGGLDLPRFLPVDTSIPSLPMKSDLNTL